MIGPMGECSDSEGILFVQRSSESGWTRESEATKSGAQLRSSTPRSKQGLELMDCDFSFLTMLWDFHTVEERAACQPEQYCK